MGDSPWNRKQSDTTEWLTHTHTHTHTHINTMKAGPDGGGWTLESAALMGLCPLIELCSVVTETHCSLSGPR